MSLQTQIVSLAQAIGADIKALKASDGNLSSLSTTAKTSLVAAINELHDLVEAGGGSGVTINDTAGAGNTTQTWSADKSTAAIAAAISALQNSLVNGAGAALDTFKELQDALGADPAFATTVATALGNRLRYDAVQTLTAPQQLQGCTNLGVGDPSYNFVADYNTAKA